MIFQVFLILCSVLPSAGYKLVVFGDIHGDYDTLTAMLRENGVLDNNNNWIFGHNKVVTVGDLIGRGHQDRQVLEFIKKMTETHNWSAQLGNHEIMQLRDDWRYAVDSQPSSNGMYELRPTSSNSCSSAFQTMTERECSEMAATGFAGTTSYGGVESESRYPHGCYLWNSGGSIHFNTHSGAGRSSSQPVCISKQPYELRQPNTNTCSANFQIMTEAECVSMAATGFAGTTSYGGSESSSRYPRGCYYWQSGDSVHFNEHSTGAPRSSSQPVCIAKGDGSQGEVVGWGTLAARKEALKQGSVLGDWLRSLPAITQEADNVFIHAGMYDHNNIGRSFESINAEIKEFLLKNTPRYVYDDLIWTRELTYGAYDGVAGICELVQHILNPYNASRLIVGHCPTMSSSLGRSADPLAFCSGTFHVVDVGISRWMYSNPRNYMMEIDEVTGMTTSIKTIVTPVPTSAGPVKIIHSVADEGDDTRPD